MLGNRQLVWSDYVSIAKRRWWIIALPAVLAPILAYVGSIWIPNRYTSRTSVLVEQQKVPDSFVKPVVEEEINQRLATMQEQILSRTRLQPIIERDGLYKNDLKKVPMEDMLERMRKSISVSPVKADFADRAGGLPGFYISFTADDPKLAQQICGEITSMFVNENLRVREQHAEGTTEFLKSQVEEAKRTLDDQDSKLAEFKAKYLNQLPGDEQTNVAMLNALNNRLEAVNQGLSQAQQQKTYMEGMVARQTAEWKSSHAEGSVGAPVDLDKQRSQLQSQLLDLQTRYTDDHPDVIKTKNLLAELDKKIAAANAAAESDPKAATSTISSAAEPRELVQMKLSLKQIDQAIKEKQAQQEQVQKEIRLYQGRISVSPQIEEQYKALTRDHQSAQTFYEDLLKKQRESEMATDLERRQQGEQFRVLDPPSLPERPTFPNRLNITLGGLMVGLCMGGGIAALLEVKDQSLRTEPDVLAALKLPVLVSVPKIADAATVSAEKEKVLVNA